MTSMTYAMLGGYMGIGSVKAVGTVIVVCKKDVIPFTEMLLLEVLALEPLPRYFLAGGND